MSQIEHVHARQILDSRGNPTVEVELSLRSGAWGRAAVPSGASTGEFEATELRDGGSDWMGKGVTSAVENVNGEIATAVRGPGRLRPGGARPDADHARRHAEQVAARAPTRSSRVSLAAAQPRPPRSGLPLWRYLGGETAHMLPAPMMNVLNGGAHADNKVDFQEFMIVPVGAPTLRRRAADGRRGVPPPQATLKKRGWRPRSATRAASRPTSGSNEEALEVLSRRSRPPATCPASRSRSRSTRPPASLRDDGATCSSTRAARSTPTSSPATGRTGRPLPDRLDRGRHGRGGLGRLGAADRAASATACSSSATTCS